MDSIINTFSSLSIDDAIDDFLHAERRKNPCLPLKQLKSVACTISPSSFNIKSCSGWSHYGTSWYNHEIIRRDEMTLLARQVAQEVNYTFPSVAWQDHRWKGDKNYWPGKSKACHAEAQLMAYIYNHCQQTSVKGNESFNICIYPRSVCDDCHDFAKYVFLATGLQFNFYFNGQRDLPTCKHCGQKIQGHLCPQLNCTISELRASVELFDNVSVELARHLKVFAKALKKMEDLILTKDDENQALSQLILGFKPLRRATIELSRVIMEFAETSKSLLGELL